MAGSRKTITISLLATPAEAIRLGQRARSRVASRAVPSGKPPGERVHGQEAPREEQQVGHGHGQPADAQDLEMDEEEEGIARRPGHPLALGSRLEGEPLGEPAGELEVGLPVGGEGSGEEQRPEDARGEAGDDQRREPAPAGDGRETAAGRREEGRDPVARDPEDRQRHGGGGDPEDDSHHAFTARGQVPGALGDGEQGLGGQDEESQGEQARDGGGPSQGDDGLARFEGRCRLSKRERLSIVGDPSERLGAGGSVSVASPWGRVRLHGTPERDVPESEAEDEARLVYSRCRMSSKR